MIGLFKLCEPTSSNPGLKLGAVLQNQIDQFAKIVKVRKSGTLLVVAANILVICFQIYAQIRQKIVRPNDSLFVFFFEENLENFGETELTNTGFDILGSHCLNWSVTNINGSIRLQILEMIGQFKLLEMIGQFKLCEPRFRTLLRTFETAESEVKQ